jgi:Leucine-rich repeat (LRR) protein
LAKVESLKQLLLDGNPIRSIQKSIISKGATAILRHLKNHLKEASPFNNSTSDDPQESIRQAEVIKATKTFDLSNKKLTKIDVQVINNCKETSAYTLNLSRNMLNELPNDIELLHDQLKELNISINRFQEYPKPITSLNNLIRLDLRGNQLTNVPNEISNLRMLRDLYLANNRLTQVPEAVYELSELENLFLDSNRIKTIDPKKIIQMKRLYTLNLQNNDISQVPPELGKATQLKALHLEGNSFVVPRQNVLASGTFAILQYLRDRMVDDV